MVLPEDFKERISNNSRVVFWLSMLIVSLTLIQVVSAVDPLDNAYVYYSFDDDDLRGVNDINDLSGNGQWGNNNGGVGTGFSGIIKQSFDWGDTTGDRLFVGNESNFDFITSSAHNYTIVLWAKIDGSGSYDTFIQKTDISTGQGYEIRFENTRQLKILRRVSTFSADIWDTGVTVFPDSTWQFLAITYDDTANDFNCYIGDPSGGDKCSHTTTNTFNGFNDANDFELGYDPSDPFDGWLDEFAIYKRVLNVEELGALYNSGSGCNPYDDADACGDQVSTVNPSLRVRAYDYDDNSSISTFSVKINNGSIYSTTNGTAYLDNFTIGTYTFNVTYNDYFNVTNSVSYTLSANDTVYYKYVYPWQSEISFNAYALISNASIAGAVYAVNGTNGTAPFKLRALNDYYVTAGAAGYYPLNKTFNVSVFDNLTINVEGMYNALVLISPRDILNNNTISGANITISNTTYSYTYTANNVTNVTLNLLAGKYSLQITAVNRTDYDANITVSSGSSTIYAYMYAYNSVWVYAYDVSTGLSIATFNVSITNGTTSYSGAGAGGVAYINGVLSGTWDLSVAASGYSTANYVLTMTDNSHQTLNAYLTSSVDDVYFYLKDRNTNEAVVGATVTQKRLVNGSLTTVGSEVSDVAGLTRFYYTDGITYTFYITKTGYDSRSFVIKPVLDAYTVLLTPEVEYNGTVLIDDVTVTLDDKLFKNNRTSYITVTFSSGLGTLEYYNVTWTSDYNNSAAGATTATGSTLNASAFLSGVGAGSFVKVTVRYKSTLNTKEKVASYMFAIDGFEPGIGSLEDMRSDLGGLGDLEKALIGIILTAIIAAFFTIGAESIGGGDAGLIAGAIGGAVGLGIMAYIGFFPPVAIYASVLVLVLMVATRLKDNG